ncbi:malonate decarboxylase epsilon subunit [Mycobacterium sp. OAS707]|uniref:acyltransferase domain-containing protein n=1 Tax=Mycobacterium sp. OAS707 TaxID=2663822 RepID=UPI00178982A7|nr:acyltransferase domain-containing protein [Mycobacterium sp. OAS707]MBE1548472.1 malonate decarboxylase epsilon subunit [Mycobacterium sp. OAS707]
MIAFLYPGQGAQHAGMLASLPDTAATRRTLAEAAELLGPIDELDTAASLASTTNAQLALLISGVATARTLDDDISPDIVAGHSVGAFAAAVGAGVLTFAEAVAAVRLRGDAMAQACSSGQWGMAALTGLRLRVVRDLICGKAAEDQLWIANVNAADQAVLGGTVDALELARRAAERAGARRFEMLDVAVASHGPLQGGTARVVGQYLSTIPRREQQVAYMTNVGARRIRNDSAAVLDDLAAAVAHPVRWFDIVRLLPELGVVATVEMPPGHVLSRLVTATTPAVSAFSMSDTGPPSVIARLRSLLVYVVPQPEHGVEDLLGPT